MTRYIFAWTAFFTGLAFLGYDIARLTITGAAVAGVWFLFVFLWLIGALRREFWVADDPHDEHTRLDDMDRPGGVGSEDWALESPGYWADDWEDEK